MLGSGNRDNQYTACCKLSIIHEPHCLGNPLYCVLSQLTVSLLVYAADSEPDCLLVKTSIAPFTSRDPDFLPPYRQCSLKYFLPLKCQLFFESRGQQGRHILPHLLGNIHATKVGKVDSGRSTGMPPRTTGSHPRAMYKAPASDIPTRGLQAPIQAAWLP